jgi:hypothetical protein
MAMSRVWLPCLLASACVLGYRGEAEFSASHDLEGIDEIRIDLPDTPLSVSGCAAGSEGCPDVLAYEGRWIALGGTKSDAESNAVAPRLRFTEAEGFAALQADVPLSRDGLVDLEMDEVRLPDDRDLDLRTGIGDVEVVGLAASVLVDVKVGDVRVIGADGGLGVHTGRGRIEVQTPGHAELESDLGSIEVTQTPTTGTSAANARDLTVRAGGGDVVVHLASDSDITLVVRAEGTIRVSTPAITTVTSGALERRTGNGAIRIEIDAEDDVLVDLAEPI